MRPLFCRLGRSCLLVVASALLWPGIARAQTYHATDDASLRAAITNANASPGATIVFDNNITLTGDLPSLTTNMTVDGGGFALSGNNQFRGLIVGYVNDGAYAGVNAQIQNLTIQNTVAHGGNGGAGGAGGGGGAGLGGAILILNQASVTVSNVNLASNAAVGGNGGAATGSGDAGGGGGLGGHGGAGDVANGGGGGGGVGVGADGGAAAAGGGVGVLTSAGSGGGASGGSFAGGGSGGVFGGSGTTGGAGGGDTANFSFSGFGGVAGFGGGGGGAADSAGFGGSGGDAGYGGGGGGGTTTFAGGTGGFGGGGGGAVGPTGGTAGQFAGAGAATTGAGGGGAGLGGAIFVQSGGSLTISGALTVNGSAVTGGAAGGTGAGAGSAAGSAVFYEGGFPTLLVSTSPGQDVTINGDIADTGSNFLNVVMDSSGSTLTLGGNNTYAGGTSVYGGTLATTSSNALGSGEVFLGDGTTLRLMGGGVYANDISLGGFLGSETISIDPGVSATWSGQIAPAADPIVNFSGGGTLTLTNPGNSWDATTITGNTEVVITNPNAIGNGSFFFPTFGPITLGDAASGGTLGTQGSAFGLINDFTLGAGGGTVDVIGSVSDLTLLGAISGSGSLTKAGAGSLYLSGDNSYTGATIVNAGSLFASSATAFGASRSLVVNSGGLVNFGGYDQNFYSIAGNGTIAFAGSEALTVGADGSNSTFNGSLTGGGSLVKNGSGTLALGGSNAFTGGITMNGGALSIASAASLGTGALRMNDATSLLLSSGATFDNTLAISGKATINAGAGQTVAWNGAINDNSSPGTLNLTGGATFSLGNASNSYSGGTTVTGGSTLAITSDGVLGASTGTLTLGDATSTATLAINTPGAFLSSRPIVIGNLGAIVDTAGGTDATLAGAISGAGGLTKTGAGALTLTGNNTFAGPTVVSAGTLRAGHGDIFGSTGAVKIASGTTIDLNGFSQTIGSLDGTGSVVLGRGASLTLGVDNSSTIFAGSISGSGGLIKRGSGTLSLTGANTYTGGLQLLGGTLLGTADSLRGNIVNNATIVFDQGSDGVYDGSMSGSGLLAKNGNGTLTLSGANTYTGGTLINAGTLIGNTNSLQGTILNNSALTFNQTIDGAFNGVIAGTGTLTKLGSGNVTFSNLNTFTGLTTVGQGTLTLNGGLPGSVTVGTQASLTGTGTIGGNLTVDGSLFVPAPTTSESGAALSTFRAFNAAHVAAIRPFATRDVPSLVINGDFTANQGSKLDFSVSDGGASPILVNGRANLIGSHLNVTIDDPNPSRTATYTALKALNGLSVAGSDASSPSTTIVPLLTQSQNSLLVTILNLQVPIVATAKTTNGVAAGQGIDAVKLGATGDLGDVVHEVLALDNDHLDDALRSLAGEIHASSERLMVVDGQTMTDLVRDQLSDTEHDSEENPAVYKARGRAPRWWFQFSGDHATFKSDEFSAATANVGGGGGGLDFKPSSNWTLGGGLGLSIGGMSLSDISGSSSMQAPRAFGYSGWKIGPFHFHGGGSASKTKTETKRNIAIRALVPDENGNLVPLSNGIDRDADADQSGVTRDAWSEWQHTANFGDWTLDSKVGVRAAHFGRDAFNEQGAGAISLAGATEELKSRETNLDFNLFKKSGAWRPRVVVTYRREFGDDTTSADVNFENRPDSQFEVTGLPVPRDTYHGLFGLTVRTLAGLEYTIEYETQQAKDESHHAFHFRMRFK